MIFAPFVMAIVSTAVPLESKITMFPVPAAIFSEKLTSIFESGPTRVNPLAWVELEKVGAVVSMTRFLLSRNE